MTLAPPAERGEGMSWVRRTAEGEPGEHDNDYLIRVLHHHVARSSGPVRSCSPHRIGGRADVLAIMYDCWSKGHAVYSGLASCPRDRSVKTGLRRGRDALLSLLEKGTRSMAWDLEYPLYLLPLEAGYVSVVDQEDGESPVYYLAIFTTVPAAGEFIEKCGIECEPRELHNSRELAWLLQSLRDPVHHVAFNPVADTAAVVESPWKVSVQDLLKHSIRVDYSPWNYPVYVIEQPAGFVSIEGAASSGQPIRAVGLFTSRVKAETYLSESGESGTILRLDNMQQARSFLSHIASAVCAVALDLVVKDGQQSAKYCFSIQTILDKYLVRDRQVAE